MPKRTTAKTPKPRAPVQLDAPRPAGVRGFVESASTCLREAQAAMTDLLDAAGLSRASPTLIGRTLGVDKTLAWKIARFVDEAEPVAAARHMPGSAGVEIVLRAAGTRGVSEPRLAAVRQSDERLREFISKHAGDRRSFESMLAGGGGGRDERLEAEERRALYRAGSVIWGVRARVQLLTFALRPSPRDPDSIDALHLSGMFEFERLREDVPWIIRRLTTSRGKETAKQDTDYSREPIDPLARNNPRGAMPLVPRFCSSPMPEIRQFRTDDGTIFDEIAPGPVGRHGAVTFIAGEVFRSVVPLRWSAENREGRYKLTVRTPVECVIFDLLLHKDLAHFGDPEARLLGLLEDRPTIGPESERASMLNEPRPALRLGSPPVMQSTRLGGYAAMVAQAFDMAGWSPLADFRAFRAEIEHPPVPCSVVMVCPARE